MIFSGASASGTTVFGGGFEIVVSGGVTSGTVISGGFVELGGGNGAGSGGIVTFASGAGGTLQLDDSQHFNGLVAGFAVPDRLDLSDIPYVSAGISHTMLSWTQLTSGSSAGDTLTLSQVIHSEHT